MLFDFKVKAMRSYWQCSSAHHCRPIRFTSPDHGDCRCCQCKCCPYVPFRFENFMESYWWFI